MAQKPSFYYVHVFLSWVLGFFKALLIRFLVPVKRVPLAAYSRPSELTPAEAGACRWQRRLPFARH